MITIVRYERLFNLGNYENEKLYAEATVTDGDVAAAWDEARTAVAEEHERMQAEREAFEKQRREEYESRERERRAQYGASRRPADDDSPPF